MMNEQPEKEPVLAPIYQIRIQEPLDSSWTDWFDGLSITPQPGGGTLLCGPVIDQAALNGLLNKVHHLNLTLLSVMHTAPENEPVDPTHPVSGETPKDP